MTKVETVATEAGALVEMAGPTVPKIPTSQIKTAYINILNYLLSVSNLQNAFYQQNLQFLTSNSSSNSSSNETHNLEAIAQNKQAQVNLLAQTLGCQATPYCSYDFHVTNASDFAATNQVIEDVGAIQNITNATLQTWAASILASNARSAGYVSALNGQPPVDGPFDTPLTPQEVTTLTSPYVITCPPNSTNIFQPGQNLTITPIPPSEAQFTFSNSTNSSINPNSTGTPLYAVFLTGLSKKVVPLNPNGTATIPANTSGLVYAEISNSSSEVDDNTLVAGPGFLQLPPPALVNGTEVVPFNGPITTFVSGGPAATIAPTSSESASAPASASSSAPATSSAVPSSSAATSSASPSSSEQSTVVVTTTSTPSTVVVTATASV
ncbi:hypothetical protein H0H92_008688 [Tricholoma furcatifolium]|nr:hypothetical protein H0H92_008688 [Tricholoma furcatifolium]